MSELDKSELLQIECVLAAIAAVSPSVKDLVAEGFVTSIEPLYRDPTPVDGPPERFGLALMVTEPEGMDGRGVLKIEIAKPEEQWILDMYNVEMDACRRTLEFSASLHLHEIAGDLAQAVEERLPALIADTIRDEDTMSETRAMGYREQVDRAAMQALQEAFYRSELEASSLDYADPRGENDGGAVGYVDDAGDDASVCLFMSGDKWAIEAWDTERDAVAIELAARGLYGLQTTEAINAIAAAISEWGRGMKAAPKP